MTDESDVVAPLQAAEVATEGVWAEILRWQEALKGQTVLCRPEVEDTVREGLERFDVAGLFKVQASDTVPEGTFVVVNDEAIEANMRMLIDQEMPSATSYWESDYKAIVDATWRGEFRNGPPDAAQPPTSEASPQ